MKRVLNWGNGLAMEQRDECKMAREEREKWWLGEGNKLIFANRLTD